jgi:hypothetical protein
MMLKLARALIGLVLVSIGYLGFFTFAASFAHYPLHGSPAPALPGGADKAWQPRGAYHLHSTSSDGRGTPSQIAQAAQKAGLQFIVITDHNLQTLPPPTYDQGVLVINGVELSTPAGHLVALGTLRGLSRLEREGDVVRRVADLDGFSFVAHPVQRKRPWTDREGALRATGMELYSADSLLREAMRAPFSVLAPALGAYLSNPTHALMIAIRPQPEATARLLELSSRAPKVALCAHDAHGFPPYLLEFQAFSLYLPEHPELAGRWPSSPWEAARVVIDDLSRGAAYCGFDALASAQGFRLEGLRADARVARVGDRLRLLLPPSAPGEASVRVWGPARLEPDGRTVSLEGPGPVQIEVWLPAPGRFFGTEWKPWIVPSPILVRP